VETKVFLHAIEAGIPYVDSVKEGEQVEQHYHGDDVEVQFSDQFCFGDMVDGEAFGVEFGTGVMDVGVDFAVDGETLGFFVRHGVREVQRKEMLEKI
jgi:hypothetical protein